MGGLRKFVDKIKPTFSEGGKLSFLASTSMRSNVPISFVPY